MSEEPWAFDVGEIVRLKSGGPLMTAIARMLIESGAGSVRWYECDWFDAEHLHHEERFLESCLSAAQPSVAADFLRVASVPLDLETH